MRRIWFPQLVIIAMLVLALHPENPYSYYILLRWICCGSFTYLAFKAHDYRHEGWTWILGITATIYNPIIPMHLTREIWSIVNIITIIIAIISIGGLKERKEH